MATRKKKTIGIVGVTVTDDAWSIDLADPLAPAVIENHAQLLERSGGDREVVQSGRDLANAVRATQAAQANVDTAEAELADAGG